MKMLSMYVLAALIGTALHWAKQWRDAWEKTPGVSIKTVLWHSPPDAIYSVLGTLGIIALAYASDQLNLSVALLAGFSGDSITDKLAPAKAPPPA